MYKRQVDGDVTLISFDATHDGLQYTLDGKINCDVECNPIQAEVVKGVIEKMQAGEEFEKTTLVEDQACVAPGIESEYATTMTDEDVYKRQRSRIPCRIRSGGLWWCAVC